MTTRLYVRIAARPAADLKRGVSFGAGDFGGAAHAGLSGYSVARLGLRGALEALDECLGIAGRAAGGGKSYLVVFAGGARGTGPDNEDLFAPQSIVARIDCEKIANVDDAIAQLAARGITD